MDAEKVTVQQLAEALDRWAPWAGAESWDNVGVLAGADAPFSAVLCALDITPAVVCEAVRRGCGAVVSHHPGIFSPLKALMPGTAPYLLAQHGVAAVCAHTNLDKAAGGVGDALAASLGLSSIEPCGEYCRRGALPCQMTARELAAHVQAALGAPVRFADAGAPVRTVGVISGAGNELWAEAKAAGCDAFVTGEMGHHDALDALEAGLTCVVSTHHATERVIVPVLAQHLRAAFPGLSVLESETDTEPFRALQAGA